MRVAERAHEHGWDPNFGKVGSAKEKKEWMTFNGLREDGALLESAVKTAFGVEARDPLGCRRITEYCFAIPGEQYMRHGISRWLVRRLMKDRLPAEILTMNERGRQSADWHSRFTKDLPRYRDEFERAAGDPEMAMRFDVPRIRSVFETWPEKTPVNERDHPDYFIAMEGIGRMITMSRFINWVNGKNM